MCKNDGCAEVKELVEAYVLGALGDQDLAKLKEHIEHCGGCWECFLSYDAVQEALILSCKPRSPRPELRAIILTQVVKELPKRYIH